jgi:hypothetical protein
VTSGPRRDKNIDVHVVKILRPCEGDRGTEIAVVRYVVDGRAYPPVLINREVYVDRIDRKRKYGKLKGFKWADVVFLRDNIAKVVDLMVELPSREGRAAAAGADA